MCGHGRKDREIVKMKRILCILAAALVLMSLCGAANAADEYTYTVRVYAGNMGTIGGSEVFAVSGLPYGTEWGFDIGQIQVTNEKYYVKGIRESGLDNDTVSGAAFRVERDMDFVVAYGVKGSEVAYTVSFVRASDGAELAPSVTYYGNVGDKPVVACKFIDGYYPQSYNITGTLGENAAANQFTFRYAPRPVITVTPEPGTQQQQQQQVWYPVRPANAGTQQAGTTVPAGGGTEQPGQTEQEPEEGFPAEPEDILDLDVPQAGPGSTTQQQSHVDTALIVGASAAGLAAVVLALWYFLTRKKSQS